MSTIRALAEEIYQRLRDGGFKILPPHAGPRMVSRHPQLPPQPLHEVVASILASEVLEVEADKAEEHERFVQECNWRGRLPLEVERRLRDEGRWPPKPADVEQLRQEGHWPPKRSGKAAS